MYRSMKSDLGNVGREKHSAFCLMQKYVHLQSLGTKLNIISAFVIERVKGLIYIEAERQLDVFEVICFFYFSRSSYHKIKREHLSQIHGKSSVVSLREDAESVKPFGLLGTQDCSRGKAAGNWRSIETFTRSKTTWNGSVAEPENQTGGPSWSEPPLLNN
ncbi:hypothetical protein Vadar_027581 [Vaccinium darrowii]|uniref:Uncharacterized protein n=1 Tax=Vaccinium darrowii TaxID=229202 RepID=A0ACB7ZER6_9ERIC|nr:hypothetical protein Vadar_027581 [Vaccinium darrowii]